MAIEQTFDSASSVMTVISFVTFLGILLWTFVLKRGRDFDQAAALPFADEQADRQTGQQASNVATQPEPEHRHG